MTEEIVLFAGEIGTQRVRVWLEPAEGGGFMLNSHDIGPGLERFFGDTEIETFLTVRAEQLPKVAQVLGSGPTLQDVLAAVVDRYRGDSAATTHLRAVLDEHGVPYEFSLL
jgi:hypothetical protein